jgi:hypothetical protein
VASTWRYTALQFDLSLVVRLWMRLSNNNDAINRLKKITVIMCYVHVMYVEKNLPINKPYKMDLDFQLVMVFFFVFSELRREVIM